MYKNTNTHNPEKVLVPIYVDKCIQACTYVHTHTCIHTDLFTYIYMYMHTYTYIYIYVCMCQ